MFLTPWAGFWKHAFLKSTLPFPSYWLGLEFASSPLKDLEASLPQCVWGLPSVSCSGRGPLMPCSIPRNDPDLRGSQCRPARAPLPGEWCLSLVELWLAWSCPSGEQDRFVSRMTMCSQSAIRPHRHVHGQHHSQG